MASEKFKDLSLKARGRATGHVGAAALCRVKDWVIFADNEKIRIRDTAGLAEYIMKDSGECRKRDSSGSHQLPPCEFERKMAELLPDGYIFTGMNGIFAEVESAGVEEQTEPIPPRREKQKNANSGK